MPTILVADDEPAIRRSLREILDFEGYGVEEAEDGEEALQKTKAGGIDLVLLDIKMPRRDGMEVLQALRDAEVGVPVVMISGHGTVETAVEATQLGAVDFLEKPPDLNRLLVSVRNALSRGELETETKRLRQTVRDDVASELTPIVGESPAIARVKQTIERVAPTEARVLITGEPGTGKELVARWVHAQSHRADGPLVEVNCAAIPSELIESELFGHEKGAFTGATKQRIGKFEQADGGTLFLDEIGDMSLDAQAKVLRALQESRITRVGGDRAITVNVRVLAATNRNLREAAEAREFREDLFHRLAVIEIDVPPLRERRSDVPAIAEYVLGEVMRRNGMEGKVFAPEALDRMKHLDWRGNVRELR
ncbi:MAG TPA: sigma-54-dependent Fis family transcriptional regulator, partial [Rhodothermales bacterium]|nr:sigma-54-dependent Fis family transcriptional regulator [Rhodothermales bacterium]